MIDLRWLSKDTAIALLKKVKLYSALTKTIWLKRAKREFSLLEDWQNFYKVEYFASMNISDVQDKAVSLYKDIFWENVSVDQIVFESSETLQWGMRLFKNHKLLDVSFKNIAKKMK